MAQYIFQEYPKYIPLEDGTGITVHSKAEEGTIYAKKSVEKAAAAKAAKAAPAAPVVDDAEDLDAVSQA